MAKGASVKGKAGILAYLAWVFLVGWFIIYWFDLFKPVTVKDFSGATTTILYSASAVIAFAFSAFSRKIEGKTLFSALSTIISILAILFILFIMGLASIMF